MTGTIIDITLVAVVVIALLVGLKKGMVKQLTGLLGGLVALVGSIALVSIIMTPLKEQAFYMTFVDATTDWFADEIYSAPIKSAEDLAVVLSDAGALKILASLSEQLFDTMQNMGCSTLGGFLGMFVADLIAEFVLWLILYIILKFVFKGIRSLLLKVAHLPVIRTIDRVLGALWAVAMAYVIIIGIMLTAIEVVILKFLPDFWTTFSDIAVQSKLLYFLHDANVLGSLLANMLEVELPPITPTPA